MDERRKSPRRRTLYRGTASYNDGAISHPCVVRDVSDGGARIQLEAEIALPDRFDLTVPQLDLDSQPVIMRWTRGREIGVALTDIFVTGHADPIPQSSSDANIQPLADRVKRLEDEIARLHRQIQDVRADIRRYRNEE